MHKRCNKNMPLQALKTVRLNAHWQTTYLFLEVSDGVLVSEGEEVEDAVFDVVILQVVHQVSPIPLRKIQYNAMQCNEMQCNAIQYNTIDGKWPKIP